MASQYDVGDRVRVTTTFKVGATDTDPTTITAKLKNPSGTTTTYVYPTDPQLVKSATGIYYFEWTITEAGDHWYRFIGTGACVAADEGYFTAIESRF